MTGSILSRPQSFSTIYGSTWRGVLKLAGFLGLMVVFVPTHLAYSLIRPKDIFTIPQIFHSILIKMLGFQLQVQGAPSDKTPVLFVANHTSYLDIPVLATLIKGSFVAKAEVSEWPLIGFLSKLQNTVFIERRSTDINAQRLYLRSRLDKGHSLILFPEGTSSDGLTALPFKSSLFSIVGDDKGRINVTVQAVSLVCTKLDGLPVMRAWRPYYAWFGDMTFVNHLWNVFRLGRFTIDVIFHPPVEANTMPDRKMLAAYCHTQVARGIEASLKGRNLLSSALPPPAHT